MSILAIDGMPDKLPLRFTNEEAARKHLESKLWPAGPVCPHCRAVGRASRASYGRDGLWYCHACYQPFTVTIGTVFQGSKVPLHKWLYANHLLCTSKEGIGLERLALMLGVTLKTVWFMSQQIREAMTADTGCTSREADARSTVRTKRNSNRRTIGHQAPISDNSNKSTS